MTPRRILALAAVAGLALTLAACGGGGGSKKNATRTPGSRVTVAPRTIAPTNTLAPGETPAAAPTDAPGNTPGGSSNNPPAESDAGAPRAARVSGQSALYRVTIQVSADPDNLRPLIEGRRSGGGRRFPTRLTIIFGANGEVMLDGQDPFINVTGTIDGAGNATARGGGDIGDYQGVEATFTGTITPTDINGSYAFGTNGGLPGGLIITYSVVGTNTSPREGTSQPQQQPSQ